MNSPKIALTSPPAATTPKIPASHWLALAGAGSASLVASAGNAAAAIVQITQTNIHAGGNFVSGTTNNFSNVLADDGKVWKIGSRLYEVGLPTPRARDMSAAIRAGSVGVGGGAINVGNGYYHSPLAFVAQYTNEFGQPTPNGTYVPRAFTGQVKFQEATAGNGDLQGPALSATRFFRVGTGVTGNFGGESPSDSIKLQYIGLMEVLATYDGTAEGNRITITRLIFDDADPSGASLPTYLTAAASYPEAVPEPSSLALLTLGAGGLLLRRRRKAAAAA